MGGGVFSGEGCGPPEHERAPALDRVRGRLSGGTIGAPSQAPPGEGTAARSGGRRGDIRSPGCVDIRSIVHYTYTDGNPRSYRQPARGRTLRGASDGSQTGSGSTASVRPGYTDVGGSGERHRQRPHANFDIELTVAAPKNTSGRGQVPVVAAHGHAHVALVGQSLIRGVEADPAQAGQAALDPGACPPSEPVTCRYPDT